MTLDRPALLLVDDRPENLRALDAILADLDLKLVQASSGEEALKCLLRQEFAVVLLDVHMPGMDGLQTAELIRNREKLKSLPIIFLTAFEPSDPEISRGYSLGAVDYIYKPIDPKILRSKVGALVDLFREAQQVVQREQGLREVDRRRSAELLAEAERRRELEQERERLRLFVLSADLLLIAGWEGVLKQVNPAFERTLGRSAQELIGKCFADLVDPADRRAVEQALAKVGGGAAEISFDCRCPSKEGVKWISWRAAAFPEERLIYAVGRDVTARKHIEELKNEFLSVASHELRTPLASIHGALGLIAGGFAGETSPRLKELLDIAYSNSERLTRLVANIADIQNLELGKLTFRLEEVELLPLLEKAIRRAEAAEPSKAVRLVLEDAPSEIWVRADANRLGQVLANLLSNAIKFSPPSSIVAVSVLRRDSQVRVSVRDHGPGIPDQFRPRVFEKFAQADSSDSREKGGSGLGLSLCKAIIQKLGGEIGYDSAPDQGAVFYFDLPEHPKPKDPSLDTSALFPPKKPPASGETTVVEPRQKGKVQR